jgi:aminoglycoside phosphotransferase (APT) family kinase protein
MECSVNPVSHDVAGIDQRHLEGWLTEHVPGAAPPFSYRQLAGGLSNLTYEVRDAAEQRFVLRRPPLGHVLESAHDMAREYRIISALQGTPVPVPQPFALCESATVTGAPFYVVECVEGRTLRSTDEAERFLDEKARVTAGRSLVDALVELHRLDPDRVGLATLGRKEDYARRQLRRWYKQFQGSNNGELPAIDEVHRRLTANVPDQRRTTIVHGDYRLDNCIVGPDGSIHAVLDWELCTLGDPLADLGLLVVYWVEPGDDRSKVLT